MEWELIVKRARALREDFLKSYKCLNIDRETKQTTVNKHINNLLYRLEQVRVLLNVNYERLPTAQKAAAEAFYIELREKFLSVCSRKNISIPISESLHVKISYTKLPEVEQQLEEQGVEEQPKMPQTVIEFLNIASKLIPDFDGKVENLQSFLDALNLVDSLKESHEAIAVNLIKTKLKGCSRNLITSESTIQGIVAKLSSSVKGESTDVISAKIMNLKQNNKSANTFTSEIEELTKSLANAFIADGLTNSLAEKYSTQVAIKSMVKNASNERVRLIMESGSFNTMNEAVAKFINSCTDTNPSSSGVFYYSSNEYAYNYRRGYNRGNGRGGGNHRGNVRGRGNRHGRGYYNRGGNGNGQNVGPSRNQHNVRCVNHEQENRQNPQGTQLGDNQII